MKNLRLILSLIFLFAASAGAQTAVFKTRISLNNDWRFRKANKPDWKPATVSGCVHTDLLVNKLIEDPYYRANEKKQQRIGKTDWEYETTFQISTENLKRQNIEVVLDGLDTYADV